MKLEKYTCSTCGAEYSMRQKRIDVFGRQASEQEPRARLPCAMCYSHLVDLQRYAIDMSDIANAELRGDSSGGEYLRAVSEHGAVELSAHGLGLRVEYFKSGAQSVFRAKSYEARSDVLLEVRSWLSDGAA